MPPAVKRVPPRKPAAPTAKPQAARRPSVIDRIKRIHFDEDEGIKVLLYGQSNTGKTTLWGTFPQPILAILCSGGLRPGELRSLWDPENIPDIHDVTLEHSSEIADLAQYAAGGQFKTVVLDHVSGLQDLVLKEICGLDEIPVAKGWGMATREQYGQATMQTKTLLRALMNLPCNVVMVAHERSFGEEGDSSSQIAPTVGAGVMPNLAGWLHGAVDYIGRAFRRSEVVTKKITVGKGKMQQVKELQQQTGRTEYCLRTGPDPVYMTKFRQPMKRAKDLPDVIVDPTYQKLLKLIQGLTGKTH